MSLAPDLGEAHVAQGSYRYRVLRDFEGALSSYKQAQQLLPNSALVNEYLGYVLRRLGRWEEAEPYYRKAIELDPLDVQLLSSVGAEYYVYLRRFKEAYVGLDRAIQIAPDADNARAVKAGVLMSEGRLAEADQELAKIPANAFDDFIVNNRLNQFLYERKFKEATDFMQRRIQALPANEPADAWVRLFMVQAAFCHEWLGQKEEARQLFERVVQETKPTPDTIVKPEANGLPSTLALAYAGLGEKEKALQQASSGSERLRNRRREQTGRGNRSRANPGALRPDRRCHRGLTASSASSRRPHCRELKLRSDVGPDPQRSAVPKIAVRARARFEMSERNFFAELKRRNVYKVAVAYAVVGWLLVQVATQVFPFFEIPNWTVRLVVLAIVIGFPIALIVAWAFELTPEGLKRTEDADLIAQGHRKSHVWIYVVIAGALLSIGLFFIGRYSAGTKAPAASPNQSASKSIAVLPFANLSADKNDEYLSDGMTEELLNVLTKVKSLRVPGRSSSFAFKGKNEDDIFRKVGEQLHVNAVLEGSVRKAGDKLRITAQLVNVADGFHLWSETYDRDMKDILAVQSDVAMRVVEALQLQLGVDEKRAMAKKPTENPEAHRLYLLGRYHFAKFTRAGWTNAIHSYEEALQVDPNFALAYCGLADTYGWAGGQLMPGREAWAKEMELAQKALELDPNLAEAHLSMGTALFSVLGPHASEKELDRAAELNPNLALIYDQYGWTFSAMGRFDDAIAAEKKALALDPLNPFLNTNLAFFFYWARRFDEATTQIRKTLELDPNNAFAHSILGWCLIAKGNKAEARSEFEKATTLDDLPWYVSSVGYAYAVSGDRAKAEQVLRDLEELAKQRYVSPANRAAVYLGLGEKEQALDWLEKAYEDRDPIFWWINGDQLYDSLRGAPRFEALVQKVDRTKAESKK